MAVGRELGNLAWEHWGQYGIPVFPCKKNKAPCTERGFYDALTDQRGIADLFDKYGTGAALIGARMGDGIFAIDFDLYKSEDVKHYMEKWENDGLLNPTRVHATRGGGLHYLYICNDSDTPKSAAPIDGIDVRGTGGYIIVPPSDGYEVRSGESIEYANNELIAELKRATQQFAKQSTEQHIENIISGRAFHESILSISSRMQAQGRSLAETTKKIMDALNASVAQDPKHHRHDRWIKLMDGEGEELSRMLNSAHKKYNPNAASEAMRDAKPLVKPANVDTSNASSSDGAAKDDNDFFSRSYRLNNVELIDHERNFLIYPLIYENEVLLISADPKVGKTFFSLSLAMHAACGIPYGQLTPLDKEGNVSMLATVYFALEGQSAVRQRVRAWKKFMNPMYVIDYDDVDMFVVEQAMDLTQPEIRAKLVFQLKAYHQYLQKESKPGVQLIIIDTLTKAMPGKNQNSTEDTSQLFKIIDDIRAERINCCIVFVHHNRKDSGSPRGSNNIQAEPDTILSLTSEDSVVHGQYTKCVHLAVRDARSIDDTFEQSMMFQEVSLGMTRQGKEEKSAVLVYYERKPSVEASPETHVMRQVHKNDLYHFFGWLSATIKVRSSTGENTTIKDIPSLVSEENDVTISRFYTSQIVMPSKNKKEVEVWKEVLARNPIKTVNLSINEKGVFELDTPNKFKFASN